MVHYSSPKPYFDCQTPSSPTNKSKPNSFLRELWLNHLAFEPSSSSLNLKDMGMKKHRFCDMIGCINGIICFGGTSLTAFTALYYGIQQSENVKLFAIPYFLTVLHAHLLPSSKPFKTYHAFGYDQYSNDYKVARIVTYHKLDTSTRTSFFTDYHNFFSCLLSKCWFLDPNNWHHYSSFKH